MYCYPVDINPEMKKQVLEDEFAIPISRSFNQEVSGMCNLSNYPEIPVSSDGGLPPSRPNYNHYSLDVVISVGSRG